MPPAQMSLAKDRGAASVLQRELHMRLRPASVGLAFGLFLAGFHALWAILVLIGAAQPVMDFIFRLHMIRPPYVVDPFSFGSATALVIVTGLIGFISGWVLGWLWNRFSAGHA
ncbi:MAG TPA: hypothetical protein VNT02_08030 [Burkholderiales bacterium]|nr:hypothetical protein [Burkholderiales bacterium]